MRKLQANIQNTHQIRPITRSDIAGPAFLALIPLGVIVTLLTSQVGGPGYPIIFAVLLVAFVTFLERAIWLQKMRKSHDLILNPRAFAPERIGFLGLTIVIAMFATGYATQQTEVSTEGSFVKWVGALLTTIPLLEMVVGSWGQLQVLERPNSHEEYKCELNKIPTVTDDVSTDIEEERRDYSQTVVEAWHPFGCIKL